MINFAHICQVSSLRWGRILGAGILAELAILIASFAVPFADALWVCHRAASQFALHGALVGLVAALLYMIVAWGKL